MSFPALSKKRKTKRFNANQCLSLSVDVEPVSLASEVFPRLSVNLVKKKKNLPNIFLLFEELLGQVKKCSGHTTKS